ncbi:MAG: hypothetical protein WC201_01380 [Bacilli bacterium]
MFLGETKNFKQFIKIFLSNFIGIALIFSIGYFGLGQFSPYVSIAKDIDSTALYIFNSNYDQYYSAEELNETAYYHYEYSETDGSLDVYTNQEGLIKGLPYYSDFFDSIFNFKFTNIEQIEEGITYSNSDVSSSHYLPFFHNVSVENMIASIQLKVSHLFVSSNITSLYDCEYIVYPTIKPQISSSVGLSGYFCATGQDIVYSLFSTRESVSTYIFILSLLPMAFLSVALGLFYQHEIDKEQYISFINYVFYKKKRTIRNQLFLKMFVPSIIGSIVAISLSFLIFAKSNVEFLLIPLLIYLLIHFIYLYTLSAKLTKRSLIKGGNDDD